MQAVKDIMKKFSIDVDNLCSFMPQDKVGAFSRYSPKDILQNTLKSVNVLTVSEKNLHVEQVELSNMESAKDEARRLKDAKEDKFHSLEVQHKAMEREIELLQHRTNLEQTLIYCKIKDNKLELEDCEAVRKEADERVVAAEQRLSSEKEKIAPLEQQFRELKRQQQAKEKACEGVINKSNQLEANMRRCKVCTDT